MNSNLNIHSFLACYSFLSVHGTKQKLFNFICLHTVYVCTCSHLCLAWVYECMFVSVMVCERECNTQKLILCVFPSYS